MVSLAQYAMEQQVALYEQLAAADPDTYPPKLTESQSLLAALLGTLGQTDRSLHHAERAVAGYRSLTAARPDQYRAELAESLGVLGDAKQVEMGEHRR